MTAERVQRLLYEQSGLLGLSGLSRNMQQLPARSDPEAAAAEAIAFFHSRARKHLAALTAALNGLIAHHFRQLRADNLMAREA
ncbi:MAG: hypothetical protein ACE5GS_14190 [Kiloniellaceae bacterium]